MAFSLDGADTKINSMLLYAILVNSSYAPDTSGSGLVEADLNKIGTLSFTQLAELRHRGAFSAVSQTFTACCQKCAQTKDPSASGLLNIWYKVFAFYVSLF